MENRKVFISYSWSSEVHQNWVVGLANRLVQDGVDVVLDKWELKEGHDKYTFMENMVTSPDIDKVLIILDQKYKERADERKGGVGTETLIITPQIYQNVVQEKFIPIVTELDEDHQAYLPAYLAGRIYIDLSAPEHFEANYEKLLRSIYNRPSLTKPQLGKPPRYLFEESPMHFKTSALVRGLDEQLNKFPNRINGFIRDFLDEFYKDLSAFTIERQTNPTHTSVGESILDKLKHYAPLQNDYIQYLDKVIRSGIAFDHDTILHFLERLPLLFAPQDDTITSWQSYQYSHFKLIAHELFLYTVAIGLKNNDYLFLEELLHSKYLIKERGRQSRTENFSGFYFHFETMDEYYKKLKDRNFYSVQADLIITRVPEGFSRDALVNADLLCYFIAQLHGWRWFPKTYVYKSDYNDTFDFFNRLISRKHFEKVKAVLGTDSVEELKSKLLEIKDKGGERGYDYGFSRIPALENFIKAEDVGSAK